MDEVRQALADGDGHRAFSLYVALLRQNRERAEEIGREVSAILVDEYSLFSIRSVTDFAKMARETLPPEAAQTTIGALKPIVERTQHWIKELDAVTRERLARETRSAVTLNELREAARLAQALVERGRNAQDRERLARFLVEALAGLARDRDRTEKLLHALFDKGRLGIEIDWQTLLAEAAGRKSASGLVESDREWVRELNTACSALREFVPGKRDAGEPKPEQITAFVDEAGAVLRAGLSGSIEDFIDALNIVREFCPTDPSFIPSPAGVEPRMFLDLGPRAKLVAVRGIAALGEIPALRAKVLELAAAQGETRLALVANVMGGLRHIDFAAWLMEAMPKAKSAKQQEAVVEAMSRIAHPRSIGLILEELARCMKKAVEPAEQRRAKMLLTALGRIGRGRTLDDPRRNRLVRETIALVGEADTDLSFYCASQMFAARVAELEPPLRDWAARVVVDAMFRHDRGSDLKSVYDSPMGFRAPMIQTLQRLGKEALPAALERAEPHAHRFSGAFAAFAEALRKIGDERAVPLLTRMIRTAFQAPATTQSYLLKEQSLNSATGQLQELDRDDVVHTMLFALEEIGGEPGKAALLELADRVQAGQMQSPGPGTSKALFEVKRKHGSIGKIEAFSDFEPEDVTEEDIRKATKDAKGGLFSKPAAQIAGLAVLGRARRLKTVPTIVECLAAKDAMVVQAAVTALDQFLSPLPSPDRFEAFLSELFDAARGLKPPQIEKIADTIRRTFPKRAPYDGVFARKLDELVPHEETRHRLRAGMVVDASASLAPKTVGSVEAPDAAPTEAAQGPALSATGLVLGDLDLKRRKMLEFRQARDAWLKGGRKGPPPEPPA